MKTRLLCVTFLLFGSLTGFGAAPRTSAWAEVDSAGKQGLPRTAIERLDPIISAALAERAYAEAIRAIGLKISLEGEIEGGSAEPKIGRLQAELEKAPVEMKPLMEVLLAHWYWQYFQQHRWQFMDRTRTAAAPGADLRSWDLPRVLTEIDRHFAAALEHEATLKTTPVSAFDGLLERGNVPDAYRPTLFDFVAHEALKFYQAGEHGSQIAEDEFEIDAAGPIFADAAEFVRWTPATSDVDSAKLKAVRLYQALLRFHARDQDRSAYLDADLARVSYGLNVAAGDDKKPRYKAALQHLIEATKSHHEIATRVYAALATELEREGDLVGARTMAQQGIDLAPETAGAALCANRVQQITAPSAELLTEAVWNAPWPTLDLTYRNVTKVYFRAIPVNFEQRLARSRWAMARSINEETKRILNDPPALAWAADLPATPDFKAHTERLPAPTSLKPGCYFIVASHDPAFGDEENQVSATMIWVTRLAMVVRIRDDAGRASGFVLDAVTGEPVSGANVKRWQRDREGWLRPVATVTTDVNGQFPLPKTDGATVALAEFNGEAVASLQELYSYHHAEREKADWRTVFFTDRAIYRPGQAINYKGVCVAFDRPAGKYSADVSHQVTVVFSDPNGQEIARAVHRTNEYGSFNGVFTAPRDRLMGTMNLRVLDHSGATSIRVEEYKRPKFQVVLDAPREAAKLNSPVHVEGKATAYTGVGIGGAKVKWRVERSVQLPSWCWWWQPPASKAIGHGTSATAPDGTFQIEFSAEPDRSVPAGTEPVFVYLVHVDITDTTGETRSETRELRAGYAALKAAVSAESWQTGEKPVEFTVLTSSLDGDPQSANGTFTVHALVQPPTVRRSSLQSDRFHAWWTKPGEPPADAANPESWALGRRVDNQSFKTDAAGKATISTPLTAGIYRVALETTDRFGQKVTARHTLQVLDPHSAQYGIRLPNHFALSKAAVEPGDTFTALWGTGYSRGRAFVELECAGKPLKSYWTPADRTQALVELPVTEALRGGFTVRVTYVRENRAYFNEQVVSVPWSNKELSLKWERFRSKLMPGEKETWTAIVSGPDARRASAEMVATLYDASLDQYLPHTWPRGFDVFRSERMHGHSAFQNATLLFQTVSTWPLFPSRDAAWNYREFPRDVIGYGANNEVVVLSAFAVSMPGEGGGRSASSLAGSRMQDQQAKGIALPTSEVLDAAGAESGREENGTNSNVDLNQVSARRNLNETAFFFPQLIAGDDGVVKMVFTMPEALTEWKFMGFAHDRQLRSGLFTDKVVTSKDLMVEPNPPRFVREGDALEFTVKVSNRSESPQNGTVRLTFADAASLASVDEALANRVTEQSFDIPANESRSYSWRIAVPDGLGFITYKAVAATAKLSDGEEGFLPVLSRRVLVTESLPLPIRGIATKAFEFTKLAESGASPSLRHQSLTVQMTSQPAWYAVMALPYLMEFPYECSEQVFNRYYANALARHIAHSDPKIRRIFDLWKNTPALESPLAKNQEIKSVVLEETPWVRQAKSESQARQNVGLLFDANRLDEESARALRQLSERQLNGGLWSWFPGGRESEYISLYIASGFGRLRHLGVDVDAQVALKSLAGLDVWMERNYREIQSRRNPEEYVPTSIDALYLYGRSFFLEEQPIAAGHRAAIEFYLKQARALWLQVGSRQSQAHLALALLRFGDKPAAEIIVKSLKERSVSTEELGRFWRDASPGWWWYEAPIETQALMIEAFAEVTDDTAAVEDCKVWLLKQKQTQDWRTTKATADAIYGLLLQGDKLLASDAVVEVALGGRKINPAKVEAGTGFYEQRFAGGEIKPEMGHVTVTKTDEGVSWGSVHWQYLEDVSKITPHAGTPLTLKKTLWVKETTGKGQVLKPMAGPLAVGDELVVRLELRTDRDMEFVHLKDQRGSGTEPVNVLSQYRYQDGLGYYESTRDTASHYFIDYLRRGTYVFEYSTRVQLRGSYQSGIAEIQCMYAPEFNSHSESVPLEVR